MAQSKVTIDYGKVYQGTAAASGGTFTADYAIPTDTGARLVAVVLLSAANAAHMNAFGSLRAEYVVENQNGTLSAPAAVPAPGSTNPLNSSTAGEATAHVQATDAAFSNSGGGLYPTAVWTISGTNARLTVTNQSVTSIVANVSVVISAIIAGSS
jgi:hypothetical protein